MEPDAALVNAQPARSPVPVTVTRPPAVPCEKVNAHDPVVDELHVPIVEFVVAL